MPRSPMPASHQAAWNKCLADKQEAIAMARSVIKQQKAAEKSRQVAERQLAKSMAIAEKKAHQATVKAEKLAAKTRPIDGMPAWNRYLASKTAEPVGPRRSGRARK